MGLPAYIYKDATIGPCANGGISESYDKVVIVNIEGPFEPTDEAPAVLLVRGNLPGTVKIVPATRSTDSSNPMWYPRASMSGGRDVGPMMGGCYVATPDSRFSQAIEKILGHHYYGAVALHDRFETPAQYDMLSR